VLKKTAAFLLTIIMLIAPLNTGAGAYAWGDKIPAPVGFAGINAAFSIMGYTFSRRLFTNATEGGADLYFGETKAERYAEALPEHIAGQIRQDVSYQNAEREVMEAAKKSEDKRAVKHYKNIKVSAKNDAHFSFNNFSYGVSIEAEHIRDDIFKIYVAAGDRYDFHGVFDDNNYFINNGNQFALKQQALNAIKNFDVHIGFIYYTQHAHDWSRESGICSICRKTLINNHLIDINLYDSGR